MLTGSQYRATWSFRFGLNISQNGTGTDVEDALQNIFLQKKPDRVSNIEARYTVAALSAACNASPDPNARTLPVEGYIQLINGRICLHDLARWVPNAEWTPVLGRLTDNADYKKYKDSKADTSVYIHKQIHGTPALGKGGGQQAKSGQGEPVKASIFLHFVCECSHTRSVRRVPTQRLSHIRSLHNRS